MKMASSAAPLATRTFSTTVHTFIIVSMLEQFQLFSSTTSPNVQFQLSLKPLILTVFRNSERKIQMRLYLKGILKSVLVPISATLEPKTQVSSTKDERSLVRKSTRPICYSSRVIDVTRVVCEPKSHA